MSSPTCGSSAFSTRLDAGLTPSINSTTTTTTTTAATAAAAITNGNGDTDASNASGGGGCWPFDDGSAGLSARRSNSSSSSSSSSGSFGAGGNVGFNGAGARAGVGPVSSFVYHTINMNCSGDMHGGIDGGVVDGGVHGGLGDGFGSGFGGSGGSVPHETDDIADILDVGLMKGLDGVSALSASAKEFTPGGGGGNSALPAGRGGGLAVALECWSGQETREEEGRGVEGGAWHSNLGVQEEMHAQVQLEAEMLELMAEGFLDCSPECLQVALAKSSWDLNRASAIVLSTLQTACDPERPSKPCRHLLGGECLRSDCAFSHDFASTTCRYWLQGTCLNFDSCHFLHDLNDDFVGLDHSEILKVLRGFQGELEGVAGEGSRENGGMDGARLRSNSHGHGHSHSTGGGGGDGGSHGLGIDDFPSLVSKPPPSTPSAATSAATSASTRAPIGNSIASSNSEVTQSISSTAVTTPLLNGAAAFGTDRNLVDMIKPVDSISNRPMAAEAVLTAAVEVAAGDAAQYVPVGASAGGRTDDDVLLAAVVGSRKGGGGVKKGGRGRKTRFTAVSLPALLRATTTTTTATTATTTSLENGHSVPSLSHPAPLPPPPRPPPSPLFAASSSNANAASARYAGAINSSSSSDGGGGGGSGRLTVAAAASAAAAAAAAAAARTTSGMSFADVVGSTSSELGGAARAATPSGAWIRLGGGGGVSSGVSIGGGVDSGVSVGGCGGRVTAAVGAPPAGWVSTGDAVGSQYRESRKDAAELARARNKLFTSATEAFRRGQGLLARDLARRGRELNLMMKEKHRQAAAEIFSSRNPGDQVYNRKTMDLHGLHVSEAVEVLDANLAALAKRGLDSVRLLTGTGHHSKGPTSKARLIPAVEHFCQSRGLHYRRIPDQGTGHVGVIDVSLAGVRVLSEAGGGGYHGYDNGGAGVDVGWGGGAGLDVSFQQQQQQRHSGVRSGHRL